MQKKHVLVVDDEKELADAVTSYLNGHGYVATSAYGLQEALTRLKTIQFDLVLTDLSFPGGGGFKLLNDMKHVALGAPKVLIMSGFLDAANKKLASSFTDAVLEKPLTMSSLLSAMGSLGGTEQTTDKDWMIADPKDFLEMSVKCSFKDLPTPIPCILVQLTDEQVQLEFITSPAFVAPPKSNDPVTLHVEDLSANPPLQIQFQCKLKTTSSLGSKVSGVVLGTAPEQKTQVDQIKNRITQRQEEMLKFLRRSNGL